MPGSGGGLSNQAGGIESPAMRGALRHVDGGAKQFALGFLETLEWWSGRKVTDVHFTRLGCGEMLVGAAAWSERREAAMVSYRILSIDGGGVRGLLVSVLLEQLDERVPGWRNKIDLLAGTSTGGIIALGLAKGLEPSDLRDLYYTESPEIFDSQWYELRERWPVIRAKYSNSDLREQLSEILGDTLLKNLKKKVLITSFDLDDEDSGHWKPKFFHNFSGIDTDGSRRAVDVALYTSAAPTYFPTADRYIDGGVVANNPSMAALAQTQDNRATIENRPGLKDIALLSIGTGSMPRSIGGTDHDWGFTMWAPNLLRVMFDGLSGVPHYQCSQILGERYHRLDHELTADIELDDWTARDELVRIGEIEMEEAVDETAEWISNTW